MAAARVFVISELLHNVLIYALDPNANPLNLDYPLRGPYIVERPRYYSTLAHSSLVSRDWFDCASRILWAHPLNIQDLTSIPLPRAQLYANNIESLVINVSNATAFQKNAALSKDDFSQQMEILPRLSFPKLRSVYIAAYERWEMFLPYLKCLLPRCKGCTSIDIRLSHLHTIPLVIRDFQNQRFDRDIPQPFAIRNRYNRYFYISEVFHEDGAKLCKVLNLLEPCSALEKLTICGIHIASVGSLWDLLTRPSIKSVQMVLSDIGSELSVQRWINQPQMHIHLSHLTSLQICGCRLALVARILRSTCNLQTFGATIEWSNDEQNDMNAQPSFDLLLGRLGQNSDLHDLVLRTERAGMPDSRKIRLGNEALFALYSSCKKLTSFDIDGGAAIWSDLGDEDLRRLSEIAQYTTKFNFLVETSGITIDSLRVLCRHWPRVQSIGFCVFFDFALLDLGEPPAWPGDLKYLCCAEHPYESVDVDIKWEALWTRALHHHFPRLAYLTVCTQLRYDDVCMHAWYSTYEMPLRPQDVIDIIGVPDDRSV